MKKWRDVIQWMKSFVKVCVDNLSKDNPGVRLGRTFSRLNSLSILFAECSRQLCGLRIKCSVRAHTFWILSTLKCDRLVVLDAKNLLGGELRFAMRFRDNLWSTTFESQWIVLHLSTLSRFGQVSERSQRPTTKFSDRCGRFGEEVVLQKNS